MAHTILFIVAHEGYQPVEYKEPKKILEQAGYTTRTASNKRGTATATDGSTTKVDLTLDEVNVADYDGIFFIGGSGALEHLDNEKSYNIIRGAVAEEKPVGAICVSTRILAKTGVMENRRATGWDGDDKLRDIYARYGVHYLPQPVVVDEIFITATGPSAAKDFGEQIIDLVRNHLGWG